MTVAVSSRLRGVALGQSILSRTRAAALAVAGTLLLSGCIANGVNVGGGAKHMAPLSSQMLALLDQKEMDKQSPILLRIYKQEAELEVWKQTREGRYALLKSYPICRWSGELGPKIKEGDRQAPEGFYAITPELMNPHSNYHLAFNLGFPNAFDQSLARTGAFLMVHGDCSSRGCYAMTDEQISEIFSLAREAFDGGQLAFQVQALPFHMTPRNLASHRNNPHLAFWRMLKEGSDHFEVTGLEPKIDVCGKRYVFNAIPFDLSTPFSPQRSCPAFDVPVEIATAVAAKRQKDDREYAALVARDVPTLPVLTGRDGGMNPIFAAKFQSSPTSEDGQRLAVQPTLPGTVPATTRPPEPESNGSTGATGPSSIPTPTMTASASANGFSLKRLLGLDEEPRATQPVQKQAPLPPRRPAATSASQSARATTRAPKPVPQEEQDEPIRLNAPAPMPGAQPIRPPGGFSFQQN
jgi:murein L,D-transpeptidase YafK